MDNETDDIYGRGISEMRIFIKAELLPLWLSVFTGAVLFYFTGMSLQSGILCAVVCCIGAVATLTLTVLRLLSYLVYFFQYSHKYSVPLMRSLAALMGGSNRLEKS